MTREQTMYAKRGHALAWATMTASPATESKRRRGAAAIVDRAPARPRLPVAAATEDVFDSADWRRRWHDARCGSSMGVYIGGCAGSLRLGQLLGCPMPKVGSAADVTRRMAELNAEHYGSVRIRDGRFEQEAGWDDWEPARISARPTHPLSPIRVLPRELRVTLPAGLTAQDGEALLNAVTEQVSLTRFVGTSAGAELLRIRGCSLDDALRYSRGRRAPVLVTEICSFGPSADAPRLIAALEWALIRHVWASCGGER